MIEIYVALVRICSCFSIPLRFYLNKRIAIASALDSRPEQLEVYPSIPGFRLGVLKKHPGTCYRYLSNKFYLDYLTTLPDQD
jgi:hypothetical protein